jgi:hypothetical protein
VAEHQPAQQNVWNSRSRHGSTPSASRQQPASKRRPAARQLPRIDTGDAGLEPARDHLACQVGRRNPPQREQRGDAGAGELALAVAADVLQEQIAERHGLNARRSLLGHERAHDALVLRVRAGVGDFQHMQGKARRPRLRLQQLAPHAVHGDPVEGGVHGCHQPNHVDIGPLPQPVE